MPPGLAVPIDEVHTIVGAGQGGGEGMRAHARGVRVLIDDVSARWVRNSAYRLLERSGVAVASFNPSPAA